MNYFLIDKFDTHRFLGEIKNWNFGIAPNGNLAQKHTFIIKDMPEIYVQVSNDGEPVCMLENFYSSVVTYSQWTENLVQSGVLHQDDTITKNSLAICASIFRNNAEFIMLKTMGKHKNHNSRVNIDAYVTLNKVAALAIDFNDELTKAQEHWHRNPQVSWDKLCQIWNKYGFLWPQKALLSYTDEYREWLRNRNPLNHDQEYTQQTFKIVWRTGLRPMYEFFPAAEAEKKAFMIDMIHQFSSLIVLNDSLFTLKNEGTGYYLGRQQQQQQESADEDDKHAAVMVPVENPVDTSQHLVWKFRDAGLPSPFVVLGSSLFLCSDHDEAFLTKEVGPASRQTCAAKLDRQQPSDSWHLATKEYEYSNRNNSNTFHVDYALSRLNCLKDGDTVLLHQNSYFLRTFVNYFAPSRSASNSPVNNSLMSVDDQYTFFSAEELESNVTQLTSNSVSSQEHDMGNFNNLGRSNVANQTYPRHADVYMEKLEGGQMLPTADYQWKIELVAADDRPKVAHYATRYKPTVKQASPSNLNHNKLPPPKDRNNNSNDASSSAEKKDNRKSTASNISTTRKSHRIPKKTTRVPTPFFGEPEQKSQWLDGYTKLYQFPKDSDGSESEVVTNNDLRMNGVVDGQSCSSLKSMASKEDNASAPVPAPATLSDKQLGKLPVGVSVQHYQAQMQRLQNQRNLASDSDGDGDSDCTASSEPSVSQSVTPTPRSVANNNSIPKKKETEAEAYKREVEQESKAKEQVLANLIQNIYARSTPSSNTTSQIRYYDDEYDQTSHPGHPSAPVTSRNQPTPASSANLSPEEYQARRRDREMSLLMLLRQETNYQVWIDTFKHATISQWFLSKTKKSRRRSSSGQQSAIVVDNDAGVDSTKLPNRPTSHMPDGHIRLQHYGNNSNNRASKKQRPFYQMKFFKRQKEIFI
ncbi:hypothetical protein BD408DRAFT_422952 [Parasitella parasitica]|nr:hypothetical protein BD408DRAFT_422952 [Parasitella parasitica]